MRIPVSILGLGAVAFAVAGCQTIGTTTTTTPTSLAVYADDEGTAGEALDNGETLHAYNAQMSSSILLDDTNNTASSGGAPDFSIRETAEGDVVVSVNGVETTFTDEHNVGWGFQQAEAPENSLSSYSDMVVDDTLSTDKHHQIWRYWWNSEGGDASRVGFAAVGTETTSAHIEGRAATATYEGYAGALNVATDDPSDRTMIFGDDLTMMANFDTSRISGTVGGLRYDPQGANQDITGGEIQMLETNIVGNGFNGNIAANEELLEFVLQRALESGDPVPGAPLGNYGGKFYGPNGEEIAGVFSMGLDDYVATGFFTANEQTPP